MKVIPGLSLKQSKERFYIGVIAPKIGDIALVRPPVFHTTSESIPVERRQIRICSVGPSQDTIQSMRA
jgi:hypothetical protein